MAFASAMEDTAVRRGWDSAALMEDTSTIQLYQIKATTHYILHGVYYWKDRESRSAVFTIPGFQQR